MKTRQRQQEATRGAILAALGEIIVESGTGFSIQEVADRAGVTHRTVYNHFPTREALNDAFAVYVEELFAQGRDRAPEADMSLDAFCSGETLRFFTEHDAHIRAYVMLMVATRTAAKVATDRTAWLAARLRGEAGPMTESDARRIAAALRMFLSSTGYHLLTEQYRLTFDEASAVTSWVGKTLLAAVRAGNLPRLETDHGRDDDPAR
jgi:AcrR family transcriptional regulator